MEEQKQPPQWMGDLTEREIAQIRHAKAYNGIFSNAGVPGHGQFVLIAKLAAKLDDLERRLAPLQGGTPE